PEVAAALEAAVPQAGEAPPASKLVRAGAARDPEPGSVAASSATAATDPRATPAGQVAAGTPIGEVADTLSRPAHRDPAIDAMPPAVTSVAVDSGLSPAAAPAHAPGAPHAGGAPAPAASAPAAASPGAPLDTRADHWHEALASRVQVLVDQHVGEARIKLSPPELGSLDVKISLVEDKTFVQLTAGTAAARDELAQSLPRLRDLFSASGLSLGGATVQGGWGGQAGEAGRDTAPRSAAPAFSPLAAVADQELEPVRAATRAAGRIDLFA
ncbi:MAG TPA: flagellar hook-length control protein FliK, partial [Gammaproteobacteria bacterium]|nr:flagellar hook-length control protein FliK [Gammaproteobacteria bacterium]